MNVEWQIESLAGVVDKGDAYPISYAIADLDNAGEDQAIDAPSLRAAPK